MATPTVKVKIEKIDEDITYQKKVTEQTFKINDKTVRVYTWYESDENTGDYDSGTDIDEDDTKKFTEEEYEAFSDEVETLTHEQIGFKTEINY